MTEQVASLGDHLALAPLERSLEVPHPLAGGDHVAERSLPALISGHPFFCFEDTCRIRSQPAGVSTSAGGPVVLWAYGRSIYDRRSAPAVRSDATRSSWLSKLHERKEKPIERTSRARSGAGRWIAAVLP
jgi:hypothetical protein